MSLSAELLSDIESAVSDGSKERQSEILARVTDLFAGRAAEYSEEQTVLFGSVMSHLINHVESRALAELSARLAPIATAPADVVRRLARDDQVEISGPVLAASERLTDEDLAEIASTKSQAHLSKIAGRSRLSEKVTDILVDHGEASVVNQVATNRGARFSNSGMEKLVMRADGDGRLTLSLGSRFDISRRLFRQLLEQATDSVRGKLMANADPSQRGLLRQILNEIADQVRHKKAGPRDYAAARNVVDAFSQDTELMRSKILEFADANLVAETIAALSQLSGIAIAQVERLFTATEGFGLMALCKAVALDWTTARAVLMARPVESKLPDALVEGVSAQYANLSMPFAQKILSTWRER